MKTQISGLIYQKQDGFKENFKFSSLLFWFLLISFLGLAALLSLGSKSDFFREFGSYEFLKSFIQGEDSFTKIIFPFFKFSLLITPLFLFTAIELNRKIGGFPNSSLGRISTSEGFKFADIWYFLIKTISSQFLFITTFTTLGISSISSTFSELISDLYNKVLPPTNSEFQAVLIVISGILISDLVSYFSHRIAHRIPLLWDLHEFHHSATEMTILSNYRISHILAAINSIIFLPLSALSSLFLLKTLSQSYVLPFVIYVIYNAFFAFQQNLAHSSIKIIYPKIVSYVFMSPSIHWLHHSTNENHYDCNFGNVFSFWDRLFNTYLDESNIEDIEGFGIENTEYNKHHPIYSYTFLPIIKILKRLKIA